MKRDELIRAYKSGQRNFAGAYLARADLAGADLAGANLARAYLAGAYLAGANLARAYLVGANLAGADLAGAYLAGANLAGAYLAGADLGDQWIIQGGVRSDGYQFFLQKLNQDSEPMVKAGCHYFSLPKARKHWQQTRGGTQLGLETFAILDSLEALAEARGLQ